MINRPQKKSEYFSFVFITFLFIYIFFYPNYIRAHEEELAPDFSLKNIEGKKITLKDYRGKVVLLNFWTTWCPPCREEMPSLEKLYTFYKEKGFVIIGISSDVLGKKTVTPYINEAKLTFPILLDQDSQITYLYMVTMRPTSYLIDPQGYIIARILGPRNWMGENFQKSLEALLTNSIINKK